MARRLPREQGVRLWMMRFVLMLDSQLGGEDASKAPPGGVVFLVAGLVGFTLAAVGVSAIG